MTLQEKITEDLKTAMKAGDSESLSTLRGILSNIKNKALEKRAKSGQEESLNEEEELAVLSSEAKKRKESMTVFREAGRTELAEIEEKELVIISKYLPEQMSEEDTKTAVAKILQENSADNFGAAMQAVMAQLKGKADAKLISQLVKETFEA